ETLLSVRVSWQPRALGSFHPGARCNYAPGGVVHEDEQHGTPEREAAIFVELGADGVYLITVRPRRPYVAVALGALHRFTQLRWHIVEIGQQATVGDEQLLIQQEGDE